MDYQRIIEDLEDVEIAGDAIKVIEAMKKVSEALQYSNTLESMLNRITTIITELEEET